MRNRNYNATHNCQVRKYPQKIMFSTVKLFRLQMLLQMSKVFSSTRGERSKNAQNILSRVAHISLTPQGIEHRLRRLSQIHRFSIWIIISKFCEWLFARIILVFFFSVFSSIIIINHKRKNDRKHCEKLGEMRLFIHFGWIYNSTAIDWLNRLRQPYKAHQMTDGSLMIVSHDIVSGK